MCIGKRRKRLRKNFKYLSTLKIDSIGITFSDRNYNLNQLKGLKYISFVACENFNLKFDKNLKLKVFVY